MFSVCRAVNALCIVVAGQMRELVLLAALDCSLCHAWFVGKILSAGVGTRGRCMNSARLTDLYVVVQTPTSFVKCSFSQKVAQNVGHVTAI